LEFRYPKDEVGLYPTKARVDQLAQVQLAGCGQRLLYGQEERKVGRGALPFLNNYGVPEGFKFLSTIKNLLTPTVRRGGWRHTAQCAGWQFIRNDFGWHQAHPFNARLYYP